MTPEQVQQLIDALQKIAPALWASLVRQALISGLRDLFFGLGLLLLPLVVVRLMRPMYLPPDDDYESSDHEEGRTIVRTLTILFSIASVLIGLMILWDAVGYLANPEFAALKYLLTTLGKGG